MILILDFGSQYTQLIARRIREQKVYCEIYPADTEESNLPNFDKIKGIILSGGPSSVYDNDVLSPSFNLFEKQIPILGICFGLQYISAKLGGKVEPAENREYGKAKLKVETNSKLLENVSDGSIVWMSHGDIVTDLPKGFTSSGTSESSPFCVIENIDRQIFGLQFHPEVVHTEEGEKILINFIFGICNEDADFTPENIIEKSILQIKKTVGNSKVLCALSGGVDSTVAAVLVQKAIGENLIAIHVDTGMMRENESEEFVYKFSREYNIKIKHIKAEDRFLSELAEISDPERKRRIIGETFIRVFEEEAVKENGVKFLVQGTLYPDVIESVSVKGKSATIKTHHNVGGLPERMDLELIEPFRELFKDEVREIGRKLGIDEDFLMRHPFPGPGLAVRVLGDITRERLEILRKADKIFIDLLKEKRLYDKIWQAFSVLLPVKTVGVMGDFRTYENALALRAVVSNDGMTADWFRFDNDFLEEVSNKIIRSVRGINRVVYDISSKPPATIEWE